LRRREQSVLSSLFCTVVGALFCIGSTKYGDLRAGFPNASFFPFMGGALLILLSLMQLVAAFLAEGKKDDRGIAFFPQKDTLKRLSVTLLILFMYGISLTYLGFLITTFFFIVALLKFLEPQKWTIVFIGAFLTSISSYTLFEILLKVQLPKGMIGI